MGGKEKNKHANKKTQGSQGRNSDTKAPIIGIRERNGKIVAKVITNSKAKTLKPIIEQIVVKGATVSTDEFKAYNSLKLRYKHIRVNHSAKVYVDGMASTNGVENFWSHLKRGINGIQHWVSKKHLQAYVNEYTFRFNTRLTTGYDRFNMTFKNCERKLKLSTLIA